MRLSRAIIYVKDLDRMERFYRDMLGLRAMEDTRLENWVEFDTGGARLGMHSIPSELAGQVQISSPPLARESNPVKLSFEVDDVAAACERLESRGVTIVRRPWGGCDGIDPEGNVFGIY
jgi:catechol 2,3-dioxygenase-like lactoylglutathione lyase family enzyme